MNKYNSFYEIDKGISKPITSSELTFPHISDNIGRGVSFLKVTSPYKYERIGDTLMGGGKLIGFSKLIIGINNYDKILDLASKGNSENVDLTLNDIMVGGVENENSVISSLGKVPEYAQSGILKYIIYIYINILNYILYIIIKILNYTIYNY